VADRIRVGYYASHDTRIALSVQYVFNAAVIVSDRLYVVSPQAESTDMLHTPLRWLNILRVRYRVQLLSPYLVYLRF